MKKVLITALAILLIGCSTNYKSHQHTMVDSNKKTQNDTAIITNIGTTIDVNSIPQKRLKKIYEVGDCGGFLSESNDDSEIIYQYGNMLVNVMNDKAVISKVVGLKDTDKFKYESLIIHSNLNIDNIDINKFEVQHLDPDDSQIRTLDIETTDVSVKYNSSYMIRERTSDDLAYIYLFYKKVVGIKVISQC